MDSHPTNVRYSLESVIDRLEGKLDAISGKFSAYIDALEKRVNSIEARQPYQDEIVLRFLQVEKDFAGFQRRVDTGFGDVKTNLERHENLSSHMGTLTRLATLETEMNVLKTRAAIQESLETYIRKSTEDASRQRQWLLSFLIGNFVALVGLALKLLGVY